MTTTSSFMSTFPTRASVVGSLLRIAVVLMAASWVVSGVHASQGRVPSEGERTESPRPPQRSRARREVTTASKLRIVSLRAAVAWHGHEGWRGGVFPGHASPTSPKPRLLGGAHHGLL